MFILVSQSMFLAVEQEPRKEHLPLLILRRFLLLKSSAEKTLRHLFSGSRRP